MDHDWWPPPTTTRHQKHGLPEVFKHGTVTVYPSGETGCSYSRSGCAGKSQIKVQLLKAKFLFGKACQLAYCFTLELLKNILYSAMLNFKTLSNRTISLSKKLQIGHFYFQSGTAVQLALQKAGITTSRAH